jgi:hypothetical protein
MRLTPKKLRLFNALKERRFTTTARILGEAKAKGARVTIINVDGAGAAWWNPTQKEITLNDANPKAKNAKTSLIYQRAKLFHELFHLLFTTNEKLRGKLHAKSRKPDRYLWISNALEDGRIEYHGGKLYEGTTWYIRTILEQLVVSDSNDSGLLIYVRTKLWRNAAEAKFWRKYEAQINEAITASKSDAVWQIAYDIVEDMEAKPDPVCHCPDCGAVMPPKGAMHLLCMASGKMSVCPTCGATQTTTQGEGEGQGGEGEGESESTDGGEDGNEGASEDTDGDTNGEDSDGGEDASESCEDDGESDGESSEDDSGEEATTEGEEGDSGSDASPSEPPSGNQPTDEDFERQIKEMVEDALERIDDEVEEELDELAEELNTYQEEQEYLDASEENAAAELTEVFCSILVESKRQKYAPCEQGGMLDPQRLVATQTGGEYQHEEIEKLSQPHIAILVDESCSMEMIAPQVSAAARVVNGAIQSSGAKSITISFGGTEGIHSCACVPLEGFKCKGWDTPTGRGLRAAHDWLTAEDARRGMVIVLTDGDPTNHRDAMLQFEDLRNDGFYVLNVLLGGAGENAKDSEQREMSHDWVSIQNPSDLVRALEVPLDNFMSGMI